MKLEIISPAGIEAEMEDIHAVRTELADGKPLTILPRHAPLIGEVNHTQILVTTTDGSLILFGVNPGVLSMKDNIIKILTSGMEKDSDA